MNTAINQIPTYLSKLISDRVSADASIINLSIGEPFFKPPIEVYKELKATLFQDESYESFPNKYAESKGSLKLRKEIALRYLRNFSAIINPDSEIIVTHGAAEAIWLVILTLTSIGDEIIIPDPSYTMYETAVKLLGRIPIKIPTSANNKFCLNTTNLKNAITERTKLLIINSPENPTGAVYNKTLIEEIQVLSETHNFYFVQDEVYDSFVFDDTHQNILSTNNHIPKNCILINSFSKKYAMMGWRLGWIVAEEPVIVSATKIHTNLTLNLNSFNQDAASVLLNNEKVELQLKSNAKQIKENMEKLYSALVKIKGISLVGGMPKAGFFLFPDVSELYTTIPKKYKKYPTIGECVMEYFIEKYKIATVPGHIYGKCGENCIRIVVAVESNKIEEAVHRLNNN